jgi:hypothetical protein
MDAWTRVFTLLQQATKQRMNGLDQMQVRPLGRAGRRRSAAAARHSMQHSAFTRPSGGDEPALRITPTTGVCQRKSPHKGAAQRAAGHVGPAAGRQQPQGVDCATAVAVASSRPVLRRAAMWEPAGPQQACQTPARARAATARAQVALKALQVWEALVLNQGDAVKPFLNNLLPFVVSRAVPQMEMVFGTAHASVRIQSASAAGAALRRMATQGEGVQMHSSARPAAGGAPQRQPPGGQAGGLQPDAGDAAGGPQRAARSARRFLFGTLPPDPAAASPCCFATRARCSTAAPTPHPRLPSATRQQPLVPLPRSPRCCALTR